MKSTTTPVQVQPDSLLLIMFKKNTVDEEVSDEATTPLLSNQNILAMLKDPIFQFLHGDKC